MQNTKILTLAPLTAKEKIALAMQAENKGDAERAIELYEQVIQKKPLNESAHKRLMVIYRKNKNAKEEMRVINRAIKIWRTHLKSLQDQMHGGNPARATIKKLSAMIEKKFSAQHIEPEPIAGWIKRKHSLQRKR